MILCYVTFKAAPSYMAIFSNWLYTGGVKTSFFNNSSWVPVSQVPLVQTKDQIRIFIVDRAVGDNKAGGVPSMR